MSLPANRYVNLACRLHGGISDSVGCRWCLEPEPLPPGEAAEDEMGPESALQALYAAIDGVRPMRTQHIAVRDIEAHSSAKGVALSFSWKVGRTKHHVTVRLSRAQGRSLAARLEKAVE